MASRKKRKSTENSPTRESLIEAAYQIFFEEGYAAVTTRRVAARAGLKPQIVHYYFKTIDDLFVAVIRRSGEMNLERWAKAVVSESPLEAVWELSRDVRAGIISMEFLALANHKEAVRDEVKRYAEQWRTVQTASLTQYLAIKDVKSNIPPIVAMFIMTSISQLMMAESALGIALGHAETEKYIEDFFRGLSDKKVLPG
jgi:AcrR family transcriptional regulator